ncbi:hypothetical protein WJX73_007324 [Symbiochloris irregularis]|uniref:Metaxin n=1 Tax=Symbiochloris irregularis TaxID=706552 RepID=A0AAW1NYT4_9CHLO
MNLILYKWQPGWGLPSISAACLEVEAYLRLAQAEVQVKECSSAGAAPSGQLPTLDTGAEVVSAAELDGGEAANAIISFLKSNGHDLDAQLDSAQKGLCVAFSALVHLRLRPATQYALWCEPSSFTQHTRAAFGAGLPVPINYFQMWRQRRAVQQRFSTTSAEEVYADASAAYTALAAHLGKQATASNGASTFFFGSQPSSLDALLFSHLAFHLSSPISPPQLQRKVAAHPELVQFAESMMTHVFTKPLPPAPPVSSPEWAAQAEAASSSTAAARAAVKARLQRQQKEDSVRRQGRLWLAGVATLMIGYILVTGQYISLAPGAYDDEEIEAEDD